jgi:hypothetical protein
MIFSGSKNNMYGLIEGMKTNDNSKKNLMASALSPLTAVLPIKKSDDKDKKEDNTKEDNTKEDNTKEDNTKEEGFQVRKPVGYADIVETKGDSWNLSKWVKDAVRYSKGMGNENRLDSYKYHTGPKIPLPEGQLFFFNNTKFDSDCCPGTYSNSKGCACLSQAQYNHLMMRGGNNTPPKNTNTAYFNEF